MNKSESESGDISNKALRYIRGPFHKSSYERFLLYRPNEFVALTNLCETGPRLILYHETKT